MHNLRIFSPIPLVIFFVYGFLCCEKAFILTKFHFFFTLYFLFITLGGRSRKKLLWFMSKSLPLFPSKNFIVVSFKFRSLVHFKFIFVYDVRKCLFSFFHMCVSSFTSTTNWWDCLFSIIYSYLLCHRFINHGWVDFFLGFIPCCIDIFACLCAITIRFWLL